jgi:hypothetical protein
MSKQIEIAEDLRALHASACEGLKVKHDKLYCSRVKELIERISKAEARARVRDEMDDYKGRLWCALGQPLNVEYIEAVKQLVAENAALRERVARWSAPVSQEQTVWFHGTSAENVEIIHREGFREGTWFARHMEDAVAFGGNHVFSVQVAFNVEVDRWQVCCSNALAPCQIEKLTIIGAGAVGNKAIDALIAARAAKEGGND